MADDTTWDMAAKRLNQIDECETGGDKVSLMARFMADEAKELAALKAENAALKIELAHEEANSIELAHASIRLFAMLGETKDAERILTAENVRLRMAQEPARIQFKAMAWQFHATRIGHDGKYSDCENPVCVENRSLIAGLTPPQEKL